MKKTLCLFLAFSLLVLLPACSSDGGDAPPPEISSAAETPPAAPEYDLINSDEYVQGGNKGIGYRVAIGDDATEEDMRAVFSDLCSGDSYALHTVWYYGLASDVETVGSFSVGMLEEVSPGSDPEFTPCTYGEELIASLRGQGDGDAADDVRSIPSPSLMQEALAPDNAFSPAPVEIFSTTAEENGLGDMAFYADGEIVSRSDVGGYDTIQVATEAGDLYVSAVLVDLPEMSEGEAVTVYFVYTGWSDSLGGACGAYVYSE